MFYSSWEKQLSADDLLEKILCWKVVEEDWGGVNLLYNFIFFAENYMARGSCKQKCLFNLT